MGVKTRFLMRDLENWLNRAPATANPFLPLTGAVNGITQAPAFGQVTGTSPRTLVRGRMLFRDLVFNSFLAFAVVVMFGLSFPLIHDSCACPDATASIGGIYVLVVVSAHPCIRIHTVLAVSRSASHSTETPRAYALVPPPQNIYHIHQRVHD